MKIALLCDDHVGVRGDADAFLQNKVKFWREVLFPCIIQEKVNRIIHLGDLLDRRKGVAYKTASILRQEFLDKVAHTGIETSIICGNHDVSMRNTNEINSLDELVKGRYPNINIFSDPTKITDDILLMPWICDENRERSMKALSTDKAKYCFGHFELSGFRMYKGQPLSQHGMSADILKRFPYVFSGHYHTKSNQGNVFYLGATGEYTWADSGDERGFHILDTETDDLTYIRNPFTVFETIEYNKGPIVGEDWFLTAPIDEKGYIDRRPQKNVDGKIVRVMVRDRGKSAEFDAFIRSLEDGGAVDVSVIEPPVKPSPTVTATKDYTGDILDIFRESCQELAQEGVDTEVIFSLLKDIHHEASQGNV